MHVVIDIPKSQYEYLVKMSNSGKEPIDYYQRIILRGVLIPKEHGRLIDADACVENINKAVPSFIDEYEKRYIEGLCRAVIEIDDSPTIIESTYKDKE